MVTGRSGQDDAAAGCTKGKAPIAEMNVRRVSTPVLEG
jgi:hypothetical protein